jgi:hypothetical protein
MTRTMTKTVIAAAVLLALAPLTQAQYGADIERDSARLASEIRRHGPGLSASRRDQIAAQLQAIRDILYGHGGGSGDSYACVSRDNDGRGPYVIGLRSGISVQRVPGTTYERVVTCESALQGLRQIGSLTLACVSRDNDGRGPWVLGSLDGRGGLAKISASMTSTFESCQSLMDRTVVRGNDALYCASRDNDGRGPYVAASIDIFNGSTQKGRESFSELEACWAFVGSAR